MAEETQAQEAAEETPQGAPKHETDWKAEARKWEARAKKSEAAEGELEKLKQAQMTEQEKANARAEKAEAELAEMRAETERIQAARETAEATGVPRELLEFCADREAMERFAAIYSEKRPEVHAVAKDAAPRIVKDKATRTNGDIFAEAVANLL